MSLLWKSPSHLIWSLVYLRSLYASHTHTICIWILHFVVQAPLLGIGLIARHSHIYLYKYISFLEVHFIVILSILITRMEISPSLGTSSNDSKVNGFVSSVPILCIQHIYEFVVHSWFNHVNVSAPMVIMLLMCNGVNLYSH